MAENFKLEIITPYRVFFSGETEMLVVSSLDGELGILANHEPIVAATDIGPARVKIDGVWREAAMADGFLEVEYNKVTMLVGSAEWPEEIDVTRAQKSLARAEERLKDVSMPWEQTRATRALRRARLRLALAQKTE